MGSSCALPHLILSSMSCDYVAGWRSFRSRWLEQRGAGEKERTAFILFSALLPFTVTTKSFCYLKIRIRAVWNIRDETLNTFPFYFKTALLRICGFSAPVSAQRHAGHLRRNSIGMDEDSSSWKRLGVRLENRTYLRWVPFNSLIISM